MFLSHHNVTWNIQARAGAGAGGYLNSNFINQIFQIELGLGQYHQTTHLLKINVVENKYFETALNI